MTRSRDEIGRLERVVSAAEQGLRLDQFLVRAIPSASRSRLQELVKSGRVRVDGAVVERPSRAVVLGERVELEPEVAHVQAGDPLAGVELRVLFADESLAVIDKPAGLLAHPGANTVGPSVSALAARRFGELPALQGEDRPGIVHRLDVGTSGLMVLGLELSAFESLLRQFRERSVLKIYSAIVHGDPRFDTGWIEAPLGRSSSRPDRISVVDEAVGRRASTYYEVRERFRGFASLECQPKTGRTHQIRVHLAHVGLPIVGDDLYRRRGPHSIDLAQDAPRPARQALHAGVLEFEHPVRGERMRFESPLPEDLTRLLTWLRAEHAR